MSELRQRKGAASSEAASSSSAITKANMEGKPMTSSQAGDNLNIELELFLKEYLDPDAGRKPGLSNEAKAAKMSLDRDPYNPELLWNLGDQYAADKQWKECVNVLCRAMPRAKELPQEIQQELWYSLANAALKIKNKDLAYDAFIKIDMPENEEDRRSGYYVLQCQVLSSKGDVTGGLKAFKNTIEGASYETTLAAYLWCAPYLGLIGAKDVAENAVAESLVTDEDRERWEACKRVVQLKEAVDTPRKDMRLILLMALIFLAAIGLFIGGWYAISSQKAQGRKPPILPLEYDDK